MDTWENLQARLFHLGWLGEELPAFVARPGGAWLFRQITREAQMVADIAAQYIAECATAGLTGPHGDTPTLPDTWRRLPDNPDGDTATTPRDPAGGADTGTKAVGGGAA